MIVKVGIFGVDGRLLGIEWNVGQCHLFVATFINIKRFIEQVAVTVNNFEAALKGRDHLI